MHYLRIRAICFFLSIAVVPLSSFAEINSFNVTYLGSEGELDKRNQYEYELLKLLLEKTLLPNEHLNLQPAPSGSSRNRDIQNMRTNLLPNFIRTLPLNHENENFSELTKIEFPIYRGIMGYRICFISDKAKRRFTQVSTINDLRSFTHVQGAGWLDVDILRNAGFTVTESPTYDASFRMVARGRVDLFCRGANEFLKEYKIHNHIPGFSVEESFALFYPFPLYFYTNSKNTKLIQRVESGLKTSLENKTFKKLWNKFFLTSISQARMEKRRIFHLENTTLIGLEDTYSLHFYHPNVSVATPTNPPTH